MPNGEEIDTDVQGAIETTTNIYLDGVDGEDAPLVRKVERTGVGIGGMADSTEIFLRRASGCDHVVHTGAEVGGVCAGPGCQRVLCTKCAQEPRNLCAVCLRPVCGSCQRRIWLRADDSVLCPRCARRWWFRELAVAGFIALLVFSVLAVFLRH
jgi:hypothetical protein